LSEPITDPAPFWRYYWTATLADGKEISQFDAAGKKTEWKDLPSIPVKIVLNPFTKDLAAKIRSSGIVALPTSLPPIEMEDFGGGLLAGRDERLYTQPTVKCTVCGHEWGFTPQSKAECPACHAHDDWFCAYCQEMKEPLVIDSQCICPTCKSTGRTRGLKRIMKFKVFAGSPRYDFQHWVRSGGIEVRSAQGKIVVRPYSPPET